MQKTLHEYEYPVKLTRHLLTIPLKTLPTMSLHVYHTRYLQQFGLNYFSLSLRMKQQCFPYLSPTNFKDSKPGALTDCKSCAYLQIKDGLKQAWGLAPGMQGKRGSM